MEGYFEQVVDTLTAAGYRWYETANFCVVGERAGGRDLRAHHNLGYWGGHDYLGLGIGAVSTVSGERRRNLPSLVALCRSARGGRLAAARAGADRPRDPHARAAAPRAPAGRAVALSTSPTRSTAEALERASSSSASWS